MALDLNELKRLLAEATHEDENREHFYAENFQAGMKLLGTLREQAPELIERLERAENELNEERRDHARTCAAVADARAEQRKLEAENERLREALRKYGHHQPACTKSFRPGYHEPYPSTVYHEPHWTPCTCGHDAALSGKEPT